MAKELRRVSSRSYKRQMRYTVEDGNAVRAPEWEPEPERAPKKRSGRQRKSSKGTGRRKQRKQVNRHSAEVREQIRANRERETRFGVGYVAFLSVVCIITVLLCINFLQLRSRVTTQSVKIASMESNLSSLKQDNDAYYKDVLASVTIDDVREAALNRLGMHYPSEDEIRYYSTDDGSYVRQYQDVS